MNIATVAALPLVLLAAAPAPEQRHFATAPFETVDIASPDDVTIRTGPVTSVTAQGTPDVLRAVRVAVRGGTLFIARDGGVHRNGARFIVTLPSPRAVRAAGTGVVTIAAPRGTALNAEQAGTGRLIVMGLDAPEATLVARGTGSLTAVGRADTVRIDNSGAGDVDTRPLLARHVHIAVHGTGDTSAAADGDAVVGGRGTGRVTVTGGARCTVEDGATTRVACR